MKKLIFSFVLLGSVVTTNLVANSLSPYKEKPSMTIHTLGNSRGYCAVRCSTEAQTPGGDEGLWEILYMICMQNCMNER